MNAILRYVRKNNPEALKRYKYMDRDNILRVGDQVKLLTSHEIIDKHPEDFFHTMFDFVDDEQGTIFVIDNITCGGFILEVHKRDDFDPRSRRKPITLRSGHVRKVRRNEYHREVCF